MFGMLFYIMRHISKIIRILQKKYKIRVRKGKPFEVLIGCLLSHRTRDEVTWPTADKLFRVASTPEKILKLTEKRIAELIYPVGFYRQKAKRIKQICKILLKEYKGKVPQTREQLMQLPGVGDKTAAIVLAYAYGKPVIAVDTHVAKIARRLGWTKYKNPEKIGEDLHRLIEPRKRLVINQLLVIFGKDICTRPKPKCYKCPVEKLCPYPNKNLK